MCLWMLYVVVDGILRRGHFANMCHGIDNTKNQDNGAGIETIDDRMGHFSQRCRIGYPDGGQKEGEKESNKASGIAQKALYGVCLCLLALIYHIAHQHLKGLHGHVDRGVHQHQREEGKRHGVGGRYAYITGIG